MSILDKIKSQITNLLSPRTYWYLAGKINPYSSAIEGEKDKNKFYKLGDYELNLFKKLKVIKPGMNVLEVGCGPGRIQKALVKSRKHLNVYGTDISSSMVKIARQNVPQAKFSVNNGSDLRHFPNDYFDMVFSFVVFQHIDESVFDLYLRESHRLLKNNGFLVFQIQSSEGLTNYIRAQKHPWRLRRYSRVEILNKLKKNQFKNPKIFDMSASINPQEVDDSGFLFLCQK